MGRGRAGRPRKYPPYQRESIFVVAPLALYPSVPPSLVPVNLLNSVRTPFHVHPPHSYAMLVVHSHLALNWNIAVIKRSVGEPAPQARTMGPGYRACKPWNLRKILANTQARITFSSGRRPTQINKGTISDF